MGSRIRAIREDRDKLIPGEYTQAAVARRLGVSANTVRSWELDRARPRKAAAKRLAKVLGVKVEDLGLEARPSAAAPAPQARATEPTVASAIIARDGKVLMTRRLPHKGPVVWNFVTGKVEPNETPEQAVVREVQAEVGLNVAVERRLGERIHPASGRRMIYFACRIVAGEPTIADHEENAEVRWSTLAEAEQLLVPTGGVWEPVRDHVEQSTNVPGARTQQ